MALPQPESSNRTLLYAAGSLILLGIALGLIAAWPGSFLLREIQHPGREGFISLDFIFYGIGFAAVALPAVTMLVASWYLLRYKEWAAILGQVCAILGLVVSLIVVVGNGTGVTRHRDSSVADLSLLILLPLGLAITFGWTILLVARSLRVIRHHPSGKEQGYGFAPVMETEQLGRDPTSDEPKVENAP